MSVLVVQFTHAIVLTALGLAAGCWLSRRALRAARKARDEAVRAQAILTDVGVVTMRVARDIDTHSTRVRDITDELASKQCPDSEMIVSTITRLVAANQELQQRLAEADTKLQEQSQQLEFHLAEARTDVLTRLPNRRAFHDEAARRYAEFRRNGTPFSLILLDLDHFKRVNDRHGRPVGDKLLCGVANALVKVTHSGGLLARYGGEEFAILLPNTSIDEAREVAEQHRQAIEAATFVCGGKQLAATVSIGVAQIMPGEQAEATLRRAERALYLSKQAGRNMTLWHDGRSVRSNYGQADQESPPARAAAREEAEAPAAAAPPPAPTHAEENSSRQPLGHLGKPLTDECDRTVFVWQVRQRIAEWKRGGACFSVMLVQVDELDQLRKAHGEAVSDLALHAVHLLLGASLRASDVVGHYRASCFSVLLPGLQLREAVKVAERVRSGATQCVLPTDKGSLDITTSIGIAELSGGDDVVRLFQRAEAALSAARKNRTCAHNGHSPEVVEIASEPPPAACLVEATASAEAQLRR